tara:strand:+ start:1341 stop:1523 length:183 start_codon:yes stop_codon:yes gene_type:complete
MAKRIINFFDLAFKDEHTYSHDLNEKLENMEIDIDDVISITPFITPYHHSYRVWYKESTL